MDEKTYFKIASTLLGKISTPFNKQTLNEKLLAFFQNSENQKNIISSITEDEMEILSIIYLYAPANFYQVNAFLLEQSELLIQLKIDNLCDRLIIILTPQGFYINPLLLDTIEDLFLSLPTAKYAKNIPYANTNVFRAMVNLLISGAVPQREASLHHFYKNDKFFQIFPTFKPESLTRIFLLYRKMLYEKHILDKNATHPSLNRALCKTLFSFTNFDLNLAAINATYGEALEVSLALALMILNKYPMHRNNFNALIAYNKGVDTSIDEVKRLIQDAIFLGIIYEIDDYIYFNTSILDSQLEMSPLTIDSNLMVSYFGNPNEDDILYLFSNIQKCDNLITYSITKSSYARAIDLGLRRDDINNYLQTNELDSTFKQWEDSFFRVRIYDGLVVQCTPEIATLMTKIPELSENIIEKLGDNLFFMKRSTQKEWSKVLAKALDLKDLPAPIEEQVKNDDSNIAFTRIEMEVFEEKKSKYRQDITSWNDTKKALLEDALNKDCLSPELETLIESKRIVSKNQIGKDFKYEKMPSAGGLNYNAKIALIKSALGKSSAKQKQKPKPMRLELMDEKILAFPLEIRGSGVKAVLIASTLPEGEIRTIPLKSIFSVTLISGMNND